ncbi:hypothetical protein SAMN06295888_1753 [Desulfonatronum zhilinae]|nr:hypothetical protein SAMN06295888_1753 [Desulfonatronum zhilinae]
MAASQFIGPAVAFCHIRPVPLSVTVPSPLSTHCWAKAVPDMTSPVRQSMKARAAIPKILLHIFRMMMLLENIEDLH